VRSIRVRVLIVDDDERFLTAVEALLETLPGVEVAGRAQDGRAAVEAAERLDPDVVVMDLDMPRLNGIDATARIRAVNPRTAVVILSGSDVVAHSSDSHAAGALAYVRKAHTLDDLPSVLEALRERASS
jgi:DNA-binding NarL/FixJ family response regulator